MVKIMVIGCFEVFTTQCNEVNKSEYILVIF